MKTLYYFNYLRLISSHQRHTICGSIVLFQNSISHKTYPKKITHRDPTQYHFITSSCHNTARALFPPQFYPHKRTHRNTKLQRIHMADALDER